MTSRDHLLGHPPAADFEFQQGWGNWGQQYGLGIPNRAQIAFENLLTHWEPPTVEQILPCGFHMCTGNDHIGISRREDFARAHKTAVRKAIEQLGAEIDKLRASRKPSPTPACKAGEVVDAEWSPHMGYDVGASA